MRAAFVAVALVVSALMVGACGGGGGSSSLVPANNTPASNGGSGVQVASASPAAKPPTTGNPSAANGDLFEINLSGALTARWFSGDKSSNVKCSLLGTQLFASVSGLIGTTQYNMGFNEATLTTGNFVYPNTDNGSQKTPGLQLTTSSNAKQQWDMSGTLGKGNVTLAGAKGQPLTAVFEGDMKDLQGGAAVHVQGSFRCTPPATAP